MENSNDVPGVYKFKQRASAVLFAFWLLIIHIAYYFFTIPIINRKRLFIINQYR